MPATTALVSVTLLQAVAKPEARECRDSQPGAGISLFLFLIEDFFYFSIVYSRINGIEHEKVLSVSPDAGPSAQKLNLGIGQILPDSLDHTTSAAPPTPVA